MRLHRFIISLCAMLLCATMAVAQTSGDKLFSQGLQLQRTMTIPSQNQAISKFQAAKKIYDSSAKKSQCEQAIQVSQGIIQHLKGCNPGRQQKPQKNETVAVVEVEPTLEVGAPNTEFNVNDRDNSIQVVVKTNQDEWDVESLTEGNNIFAQATKRDDKIYIYVMPNFSFEPRTQSFLVTAGELSKKVVINQQGKNANLCVSEGFLKFKSGGGRKNIEVLCNSTLFYPANSYQNWYVDSAPDWVNVTLTQKGSSFKESGSDTSIKKAVINVSVESIKGTQYASTGRQGEIVIKSGSSTVIIYVTQSK